MKLRGLLSHLLQGEESKRRVVGLARLSFLLSLQGEEREGQGRPSSHTRINGVLPLSFLPSSVSSEVGEDKREGVASSYIPLVFLFSA